MYNIDKKTLFIYGPTASGKTEFAEKIASLIPAEIVNMDSAQMYTLLRIGTAKPDWQTTPFKQHLFDIIDEPCNITVHAFRQMAEQKIKEIHERNRLPIFVGGSGFYLKSLFFKLESDTVAEDPDDTELSLHEADLWQQLHVVDPDRAAQIHSNDIYRLRRALEIWRVTGQKPSLYRPQYAPISPWLLVHVTRNRKNLYRRIDERVLHMLQTGWITEVQELMATGWESFMNEKGIIGYAELIGYLKHMYTLEQATELIQQRSRNYAKRQETFWRMLKKYITAAEAERGNISGKIIEFDLTYQDIDLYIKQLLDDLSTLKCGDV
jgi:tRNA dimethylallyltransferase